MKKTLAALTAVTALAFPVAAQGAVVELGEAANPPAASCPENCQAIGRVTGFQVRVGETANPYRVRERGKIVAFSIRLGKPRADQSAFFDNLFGGPPRARLTVLRAGTKRRHRLVGRSEVFNLGPYLGSTPTFALARPLTVRRDYVVALTVPTWAPAFGVGLAETEAWRSSRDAARCNDVNQVAAQQRRGSLRTYGCLYRTARLLYTATFVPDPPKTPAPEPEAAPTRSARTVTSH